MPRAALGWSQVLLILGMAWTAYTIIHVLPFWSDDALQTTDAWRMYGFDLKRCIWAILPATFFWGASFPSHAPQFPDAARIRPALPVECTRRTRSAESSARSW